MNIQLKYPRLKETQIEDIPLGQIFTAKIGPNSDWLFKKIEIAPEHSVILSLSSDGTYGHYWTCPPINNYVPIEFIKESGKGA